LDSLRLLSLYLDSLLPEGWDLAQNTVLQKPTRVIQAQSRLDNAVARLETAIQRRALSGAPDEQIIALESELQSLQTRNASLKQANDEVDGRLNSVIANLKSALES
jgi:hypothetical protein